MPPPDAEAGWPFASEPLADGDATAIARAYARCFASPEGQAVLAHLEGLTRRRALGPAAHDAALRHLEGQRQLVALIAALAERGRNA
jgi:hypothetical protein